MPDLLERPEEQVIELRLYHFLVRAASQLDLPAYGLLAGDGSTVRDLGSFGCRLEQSVTLFELIETFTRTVSTVASHARFWIVADEDDVWFCRAGLDLLEVGEHHAELFVLGLMKQIVRLAAGPDWMPKRIRLKRKDPTREPFAEGYEGAEILFAQPCTAIAFPPSLLPRPLVRAAGSSLVEQLRKILRSHSGDLPDVHRAASSVGCSTRTLQRTLAREGLSYRRLTDQARYAAAIPLLRDAELAIVDVAHETGYSDQAHFTRAFRRWTGMSPARFRRMQGIP
jgi:AraC-like DNA-binding protein